MAKFKKLALLCTAILACGVIATTTGCDLFQPIPDGPTSESSSSSSEIPEVTKYTIKFVNEDGTVLQESQVEEGQIPAYTGATPTKAATAQYSYTFAGWDATLVEAMADATYTATFTESVRNYTVSFDVDGGSAVEAQTVPYGTTASGLAAFTSTKEGYEFKGWTLANGDAIPEGATVTEDGYYTLDKAFAAGEVVEVAFTLALKAHYLNNKIAFTYGALTLAVDELKASRDLKAPVVVGEKLSYKLLPVQEGELVRIECELEGGEKLLLADYQSCGKKWLSDKPMMTVWFNTVEGQK